MSFVVNFDLFGGLSLDKWLEEDEGMMPPTFLKLPGPPRWSWHDVQFCGGPLLRDFMSPLNKFFDIVNSVSCIRRHTRPRGGSLI